MFKYYDYIINTIWLTAPSLFYMKKLMILNLSSFHFEAFICLLQLNGQFFVR